jgi:long-chain acyl-CoA synthetase
VVTAPDPDEGQVPVTFVVPKAGAFLTPVELVDYLRTRIAAYKIPAASACATRCH